MDLALKATLPAPSCEEHELVDAVREGSDGAFAELYNRYCDRIFSYIAGMVGDQGRAEDIAQEVFISALRRLRATQTPIAFRPWIYQIAKNACVDEYRRTRRTREVPLEPESEPALSVAKAPSLDQAVENKQLLADLRGAFGGLSESQHQVMVLRELEGLSYEEISRRLGVSKAVVESTLFRARRRLSQEYEELASGRRCEQTRAFVSSGASSWTGVGIRRRRQLARHLAHCQPCRRYARAADLDEQFFNAPGLGQKLAALLPLPWLRNRRARAQGPEGDAACASGPHGLTAVTQLGPLTSYADQVAPTLGLGRAAVAAAALVIGSGGVVTDLASNGSHDRASSRAKSAATSAQRNRAPRSDATHAGGHSSVAAAARSTLASETTSAKSQTASSGTSSTQPQATLLHGSRTSSHGGGSGGGLRGFSLAGGGGSSGSNGRSGTLIPNISFPQSSSSEPPGGSPQDPPQAPSGPSSSTSAPSPPSAPTTPTPSTPSAPAVPQQAGPQAPSGSSGGAG
jgi:RNA polymerase sigma factor (sigma-70 family)